MDYLTNLARSQVEGKLTCNLLYCSLVYSMEPDPILFVDETQTLVDYHLIGGLKIS
jgi:hypothetical protein